MTNKYMYFIANWKMFGGLNSLKSLNKVGSKLVLDFLLLKKLISQFCSLFKLIIFFKAITVPMKNINSIVLFSSML